MQAMTTSFSSRESGRSHQFIFYRGPPSSKLAQPASAVDAQEKCNAQPTSNAQTPFAGLLEDDDIGILVRNRACLFQLASYFL
jgi:hypothetical protein